MRYPEAKSRAIMLAAIVLTASTAACDERIRRTGPSAKPQSPAHRIVVSIPDRKLALLEDDRVLRIYSTAVGAAISPSPVGAFTVVSRLTRPTYYAPGKVIPPGSANPLGTRWIGLSARGFGIHGTNRARSVGRAASHGCIRMRNREVEELFELVQVGDVVEVRAETDERLNRIFAADRQTPAQVRTWPASETAGGQ